MTSERPPENVSTVHSDSIPVELFDTFSEVAQRYPNLIHVFNHTSPRSNLSKFLIWPCGTDGSSDQRKRACIRAWRNDINDDGKRYLRAVARMPDSTIQNLASRLYFLVECYITDQETYTLDFALTPEDTLAKTKGLDNWISRPDDVLTNGKLVYKAMKTSGKVLLPSGLTDQSLPAFKKLIFRSTNHKTHVDSKNDELSSQIATVRGFPADPISFDQAVYGPSPIPKPVDEISVNHGDMSETAKDLQERFVGNNPDKITWEGPSFRKKG